MRFCETLRITANILTTLADLMNFRRVILIFICFGICHPGPAGRAQPLERASHVRYVGQGLSAANADVYR